ncbi:MAG: SRPBCC domain-containing protein [Chloroflexi bacterium]|nr:SRPBCC domain-containing protein [Chloroflexota bacterium]
MVQREIRIAARPETVFSFLVDPARMVRWMGVAADLDPRPGGLYRVSINPRDAARGSYLELAPHRRVVFTWGWEGEASPVPPGSSTVEISLVPDGDGTIVRLRHLGLPVDQREQHTEGWGHYLARLAIAAEGRDPGPDPWAAPAA